MKCMYFYMCCNNYGLNCTNMHIFYRLALPRDNEAVSLSCYQESELNFSFAIDLAVGHMGPLSDDWTCMLF